MKTYLNDVEYCEHIDVLSSSSCIQNGVLRGGRWDKSHELMKRVYSTEGCSPTIHTMQGGNTFPKIMYKSEVMELNENYRIRKLTPKECWHLMGMTKIDCQKAIDIGVSDSQLYKIAGNGLVTNCVQEIFEHLYKAIYDENYICTDEKYDKI